MNRPSGGAALREHAGSSIGLASDKKQTVNELAHELQLTDNAVRAHLVSLERDGMVRRAGTKRGVRRPHLTYAITEEADHVFSKGLRRAPEPFRDCRREAARISRPPRQHATSRTQNRR